MHGRAIPNVGETFISQLVLVIFNVSSELFDGALTSFNQYLVYSNELTRSEFSGPQEWCSRCSSTIYALNKHWFEFLQKRAQEDFALPQYIMSCRTPVEVWTVYMQFLQKAVTDYQKEFVELGKLGIVVGSEPVTQKPKKSTSRVDEFRRSAFQ